MPTTVQTTKRWTETNRHPNNAGGFVSVETVTTEYPEPVGTLVNEPCDPVVLKLDRLVDLSAEISEKLSKMITVLWNRTP